MKRAAVLFALVLAACGGGNTQKPPAVAQPVIEVPAPASAPTPAPAPKLETPAPPEAPKQEQQVPEPWQTQPVMPPAGHWLWSVPPDQSPLWQRIEPEQQG